MYRRRSVFAYPTGWSEGSINVKETDGVFERTVLQGREAGSHGC